MFQTIKDQIKGLIEYANVIYNIPVLFTVIIIPIILFILTKMNRKMHFKIVLYGYLGITTIFVVVNFYMQPQFQINNETPKSYTTNNCHNRETVDEKECNFGPKESKSKKLILIGDSHAAQYLWGLQEFSSSKGLPLISLTHSACPSFPIVMLREFKTSCINWAKALDRYLDKQSNSIMVFSNATNIGYKQHSRIESSYLAESFLQHVEKYATRNHVLIISDTPRPKFDVARCLVLAQFIRSVSSCDFQSEDTELTVSLLKKGLQGNFQFYLPTKILCKETCLGSAQGKNLYRDDSHLSIFGSLLLSKNLQKVILQFSD